MNGLLRMRSIDWRRSGSRSGNDSAAQLGLTPVSSWSSSRKSSSRNVSIPQSVWWIRTISSVPSLCWEIASGRIVPSGATPPAFGATGGAASAGVGDEGGVALLQAQHLRRDEPRVHARDDGELAARGHGQVGFVEAR